MELTDDMKTRLNAINEAFTVLLNTLEKHWLPGRTMAIAQTKIEEAHMWLMQMPTDPTIREIAAKQAAAHKIIPVSTATPELVRAVVQDLKRV